LEQATPVGISILTGHLDPNGPPLTEAQRIAAEGANQAEHGILVDTASDPEQFSDDGYETDGNMSASTSLASTMYNYSFENGRRYHKFREGTYNFPNDDAEQEREDMKHAMVVNLCQVLHFAPVKNMDTVLDMGTGTGIWAIESMLLVSKCCGKVSDVF
jgi:hypothetical protein